MENQQDESVFGAGIAEALAHVAIEASGEPDLRSTLARIAAGAAATVETAGQAHIATVQGDKAHIMAATTPEIAALAETMYKLGQGPGPSVIQTHRTVTSGDLAGDDRWPAFAAEAAARGVRSMMSLPLRNRDDSVVGSLSLYSSESDAFDGEAAHVAELFAMHATVVLAGELDRTGLQNAISSRDLIGTAKGILMCQRTCTDQQAFNILAAASQRANIKLRDVAEWIVADANDRAKPPQSG